MKTTIQYRAAKPYPVWLYLSGLLLAAVLLYVGSASAAPVGKVISLSDPSQLLAKKADGKIKVLNQNSTVENGDVLVSQNNTYAKVQFIDNTQITLAPNTEFKIENYSFDKEKPQEDRSVFTLLKGTLRSITGSLGQRSKDRYQLSTPAATIGIRGTTYLARYIPPADAKKVSNKDDKKEVKCDRDHSALTTEVIGGSIYLKNDAGEQLYNTGQFGCVTSSQDAPEVLTTNPGIEFNPTFNKSLQCKV